MKRMVFVLSCCLLLPSGLFAVDKPEIKGQPVAQKSGVQPSFGRVLKSPKKIRVNGNIKHQLVKLMWVFYRAPKRGLCVLFI